MVDLKEGLPMDTGRYSLLKRPRRRQAKPHPYPLRATWPQISRSRAKATRPVTRARGPAWVLLYALLPFAALLCAFAEYFSGSGGWRRLTEGLVAFLVIGLAWVWVRANRGALSRVTSDPEMGIESQNFTVEVQKASPQVIRLEPRRSRSER
jgi:hypothetical protein